MALSDLFGINSTAGTDEMKNAIAQLQAIGVPNAAQLTLPELQKYVIAGVLTPEQYQAVAENPDAYKEAFQGAQDTTGSDTQKSSIEALNDIINNGGESAISDAYLRDALNQTNQEGKAQRGAIMQNAQERNASGNGLEFINQLLAEQGQSQNLNNAAVQSGANNAQMALQALTQKGQLGGQLQGQSNQNAQAQAQAAAQIAQYNSQLQSAANQYNAQTANSAQAANLQNAQDIGNQNTTASNQRTQYNAGVPQQVFQDQLQKANAVAGGYSNAGKLAEQQAQNQNAFTGNLIGAGATALGGAYGGPMGAMAAKKVTAPPPQTNDNPYGNYAEGGTVKPQDGDTKNWAERLIAHLSSDAPIMADQKEYQIASNIDNSTGTAHGYANGGMCYAQGGEVHDHNLCMEAGGPVPGDDSEMPMGHDDESQDVVDAHLSPNEIVLPRSVAQAPDAPQAAAQFVGQIKGQDSGMQGNGGSFADVLAQLEANGIELRLASKGA